MPYIVYYSTEVVITQPLTRAIIYNSPIISIIPQIIYNILFTISYLQYLIYNILFTILTIIYNLWLIYVSISYSLHDALRSYHDPVL